MKYRRDILFIWVANLILAALTVAAIYLLGKL